MIEITSLENFRSIVSNKKEIRESSIGEGFTSFCYMIGGTNTFDTAFARECRGIVFDDKTGAVVGRPLHKFFNLNERESTQAHLIDWSKVAYVMEKRDGSMLHTVVRDGKVLMKTKKSFNSDVALVVQEWIAKVGQYDSVYIREMLTDPLLATHTLIFEWTSPSERIVLAYDRPALWLLHARNNVTGQYLSRAELVAFAYKYDVPLVDEVTEFTVDGKFDVSLMVEAAATREDTEGWVVQFENGEMIKVKTEWYLARHRVMTFIRERDIAELVVNETIDDFKSSLVEKGIDLFDILEIEDRVVARMSKLVDTVETAYKENSHLEARDMAAKFRSHELFGLIMKRFNGSNEIRYGEYFTRNILKSEFSLNVLTLRDVNGNEVKE